VARGKWIREQGTKFIWNSLKLMFNDPLKHKEAVIDETTWAINLFKLTRLGEVMPRLFIVEYHGEGV
jgi:hypothetical protein